MRGEANRPRSWAAPIVLPSRTRFRPFHRVGSRGGGRRGVWGLLPSSAPLGAAREIGTAPLDEQFKVLLVARMELAYADGGAPQG